LDTTVKFVTTVNNTVYTFNVGETQVATLTDGIYTFEDVEILEGSRLANEFTITSDTRSGPLVIPVSTVDITSLTVAVQNSINDVTTTMYTRATGVVDVLPTSAVYWVEENPDGNYQIVFGDDIIGKKLTVGNIVTVAYIAASGSAPNSASTFSLSGDISGETNVTVQTIAAAAAGSEKETIDEIRFNAPKFNATRNRVVTAQDYKSLILASLSSVKSAVVWGGEENIPPIYGKVFITLDPEDGAVITDNDKTYLINEIFKPRSVMTVDHEFVDPEYLYLGFDIALQYDPKVTNYSATDLTALVRAEASNYFTTNLSTLDKTFFFSQFVDALTSVSAAIVGILVNMRLQLRIANIQSFNTTNDLRFLAALEPGSIHSTTFSTLVRDMTFQAYLQDFPNDRIPNLLGTGTISLIDSVSGDTLVANVGQVNYGTGVLSFSDLNISAYLGNIEDVRITAIPQEMSKNISSKTISATASSTGAVIPAPSRNIIIRLDDSDINSDINLQAGVTVSATPYLPLT